MNEIKNALNPLADLLPPGRDFLNKGGGWLALGVAALLALLVLWLLLRGLGRLLFGKRQQLPPESDSGLDEDLAEYPPAPGAWGRPP